MRFPFHKEEAQAPYIIAGLGNPGDKYAHTRHNMGFDAVDVLAQRHGIVLNRKKFRGIYGKGEIAGQRVLLVKPQTYMNLSGECLAPLAQYFGSDPAHRLIVLCDDIHLEPGHIRVRTKGSAGGHNGLKNIIAQTGTDGFVRIRIGVGEEQEDGGLVGHVLGHLSREEQKRTAEALEHAADAAELILAGEIQAAMNRFNRKEKI